MDHTQKSTTLGDSVMHQSPTNSINLEVHFDQDPHLVLAWCMKNLVDEGDQLSGNKRTAWDAQGSWRWIMNWYGNKMRFSRQDDVIQFLLAWGACA